jgi:hypothetical protein
MPLFRVVQGKGIAAEAAPTGFLSVRDPEIRWSDFSRDAFVPVVQGKGIAAEAAPTGFSLGLRPGDSLERLQSRCLCSGGCRARASRLKPLQQVFRR